MSDSSNVGKVGVGAAAVLGGLALHSMDDLARAGMVGARSVDDVARVGAMHADDAARTRPGFDNGVRRPTAPRPAQPIIVLGDDGARAEKVGELGVDVAVEVVPLEFESDAPTPEFVEMINRPKFVNLMKDPDAWARLSNTGEDAQRAPWIFSVRPGGDDAVRIFNDVIPFEQLAATCWRLGTTCVFIACSDDACASATHEVLEHSEVEFERRVDVYTAGVVDTRLETAPQPVFVMTAGGSPKREFTVIRPGSVDG